MASQFQSFPSSNLLSYSAKTHANTGYILTSNDDFILWTLTNASNDTCVIPAAASNAGKVFRIKLAATTAAFNTLTATRTSSDTFTLADGTTGATSLVFFTQGEEYELVSDGVSVWQVLSHRTITGWVAYTPVTQGFGIISSSNWRWRRNGDSVEFCGRFTSGTITASEARIGFPAVGNSDSTVFSFQVCGIAQTDAPTTNYVAFGIFIQPGVTYINFGYAQVNSTGSPVSTVPAGGTSMFANSQIITISATVPISGWKP